MSLCVPVHIRVRITFTFGQTIKWNVLNRTLMDKMWWLFELAFVFFLCFVSVGKWNVEGWRRWNCHINWRLTDPFVRTERIFGLKLLKFFIISWMVSIKIAKKFKLAARLAQPISSSCDAIARKKQQHKLIYTSVENKCSVICIIMMTIECLRSPRTYQRHQ